MTFLLQDVNFVYTIYLVLAETILPLLFAVCGHCSHLLKDLNFNTMKICFAKKDLLKEMKLIEIDKYLRTCLNANPIFFIEKKQTKLTFLLTALIRTNFFTIKKPCKYIFIFSVKSRKSR